MSASLPKIATVRFIGGSNDGDVMDVPYPIPEYMIVPTPRLSDLLPLDAIGGSQPSTTFMDFLGRKYSRYRLSYDSCNYQYVYIACK